jgi:hypothetical protein
MSEMRQERGQMGKANGILSKSGSHQAIHPCRGTSADQGKSPSQPYHCLSRSSDNSVSDVQKSRLMYGCAGTPAEGWLKAEDQLQERLTLKSWQSGLTI